MTYVLNHLVSIILLTTNHITILLYQTQKMYGLTENGKSTEEK